MAQNQDLMGEAHTEKSRLHETLINLQDDVTQFHAHIDLYKIRLKEEYDEKEFLKVTVLLLYTVRYHDLIPIHTVLNNRIK